MTNQPTMDDIMHPHSSARDAGFPHAPEGWSRAEAEGVAKELCVAMDDSRWELVLALQEYFDRHSGTEIRIRELHDALDECFHSLGGVKYLYTLFPGGPVTQGCRIAGLEAPAVAADSGFGSVM